METKNKTGFVLSAISAIILLVGGIMLLGYILGRIPDSGEVTVLQVIGGACAAFIPILAGGFWLGALYRRSRSRGDRPGIGNGIVLGAVLILTGLFMLSFSTGIFPALWRPVFISWQMLLIVIGLIELFKARYFSGLLLIIIGKFFLIPKIAKLYPDSWIFGETFTSTYWPVLLILFGLIIILGIVIRPRRNCNREKCGRNSYKHRIEEVKGTEGTVDYNLLFTGSEQVFLDPVFRGGHISVVFAGVELDLRKTSLPEGVTYLEVSTVFGGVNLFAPPEWRIEIRNESVVGGFSDKRPLPLSVTDEERKLVIVAKCVFGGGEVK